VNLLIQEAAEQDILLQVEWYAQQGLPQIARHFHSAITAALSALVSMPEAGPPKASSNPLLTGLRAWPVSDFDAFWIYYLVRPDRLTVVRILHSKRDTTTILNEQDVENP
jgi:plasmid stabilization system protein ParE